MVGVTAAILAGGLGTRLRPVVSDKPKVLAEIQGRPFLAYLLDQLAEAGIGRVVICTGYLGKQVQDTFGDLYGALRLLYSEEATTLGTAGALRLALPLLQSGHVLVMNGDSYTDLDFEKFRTCHQSLGGEATLALVKAADTDRFGTIALGDGGRIIRFKEKEKRHRVGWINAGVYILNRSLISTIPPSIAVSLEREMFPSWINRGLYGYLSGGDLLDIGTPEAYLSAEKFFVSKARKTERPRS